MEGDKDYTEESKEYDSIKISTKSTLDNKIHTSSKLVPPLEILDLENQKRNKKKESEDEVIDLTKLKENFLGFFKKSKNKETYKNDSISRTSNAEKPLLDGKKAETEDLFNYKKFTKLIKNNLSWLIPLLLLLIVISTSTYLRIVPLGLPITDSWAEDSVLKFYRQQVSEAVNREYPGLPPQNRDALVETELNKILREDKDHIEGEISKLSLYFKDQFRNDQTGEKYMTDIDSYLWYSQARNVINYGHLGDKIVDGKPYFTLRDGRLDKKSNLQLHPYFAAYLHKFLNFFNPDFSLMKTFLFLPIVIIGLALIPAFFIGRRLAGNLGGFFAAIFLAINGTVFSRSSADTDPHNILFPLFIVWLFFEAYNSEKRYLALLYSILSGLFVGAYAFAWSGWPFILFIVIAAVVITNILKVIKELYQTKIKLSEIVNGKKIFNDFKLLAVFFLSSAIFVTLFVNSKVFVRSLSRVIRFTTIKEVGIKSIWPNVLTTVAEFNTVSFTNFIPSIGGKIFFLAGLMGVIFLLIPKEIKDKKINFIFLICSALYYLILAYLSSKFSSPFIFILLVAVPIVLALIKVVVLKEEIKLIYPILLLLWMLSTIYSFTKGVRFSLLIVPSFAIAFGFAASYLYHEFGGWITSPIKRNKKWHSALNLAVRLVILIVLLLSLIAPVKVAYHLAKNEVPGMNDAWYQTLIKIKENTKDAIITSWWDFGHWFVAIAERRVTFDGGDQGQRIHWVGKILKTDNEQEAVGILRMLNCFQEKAPGKLDEFTGDSLRSLDILNEVLLISDRVKALQKYQDLGLTKEQSEVMVEYTHCDDLIPNFFITSQDMVGKAGVWGHFGSWDFKRATMYQKTNNLSKADAVAYLIKKFNFSEAEAGDIYADVKTKDADRWIAPWPGFLTSPQNCSQDGDKIICNANLQDAKFSIEVTKNNARISGTDAVPNSLVFATPEGVYEQKFEGKKIGLSVILIPDGDNYKFVLADPSQAAGMFTRLFYLEGHGLKCFKKFYDVVDLTNLRIITWEVDFSCQQNNREFFN